MEDIFTQFPDKETFDAYWNKNYVPLTYEDVREEFENYVKEVEGHVYLSDYEENGCVSKADFLENLSQDAQFMFQDTLTEIFYEKNPTLYEVAFALYEEAQMNGAGDQNVAKTFHETYQNLYRDFINQLFDEKLA